MMKRVLIAGLAVLMAVMVGMLLFTGCGGVPQEVEDELKQLRAKEKQWTEWELELEQLSAEKKNWEEVEKPALEKQVAEKETQIGDLESQITDCKSELGNKDEEIEELEAQVAELQAELAEAPKNPNYNEVKGTLLQYKARQESYQSHSQYTYAFLEMAKERGVRGYPVGVLIKPNRVLIFAGFETSDKGWVYILAAQHREVQLEVGKSFRELNETSPFGPGDDTILQIMPFD